MAVDAIPASGAKSRPIRPIRPMEVTERMDLATSRPGPAIRATSSVVTPADHWDHVLARWAYRRDRHRVAPGLYALGSPTPDSPVLVTANYTLSFDALRSALPGTDAYILVLETYGINVWCAAGKGSFGTAELVRRIEATGLREVVRHRALILPQLGAPGVSAHEVKAATGFRVEYGPVRAADLPEYLKTRRATPEMRRIRFGLADRLTLIPVELVSVALPVLALVVVSILLGWPAPALGGIASILAGVALFPMLLPWLPTHDFSSKGLILGFVVALPFAAATYFGRSPEPELARVALSLACLLSLPAVTAYLALNFTGATTFTSRSGVQREIRSYIPPIAGLFAVGIVLAAGAMVGQVVARGGI